MNLDTLFSPKSVAVIGASSNPDKVGYQIFQRLITKGINAFPVNPNAKTIITQKAYPSILAIPEAIDQAIIVIPATFVISAVKEAIAKKVKNIVIITAGFSETSTQGKAMELEIKKLIKKTNISLLGPNCLGYSNPQKNIDITFAKTPPPSGNIALISQSGAVGSYIFDWAKSENLGLSKFASLGNRLNINENDCLEYLVHDQDTKVIGLYLESFAQGETFIKVAKKITTQKPVIIIFGGQTNSGRTAAASHTASLSPQEKVISTAIKQSGCIQAKTLEEFTGLLEVFSLEPKLKDNDIAILTNAGGPGILAADQIDSSQLNLTSITDVLGDAVADKFKDALNILTHNQQTDAFLVIISPQTNTELELTAELIVKRFKNFHKPVIVSLLGGDSTLEAIKILQAGGIATIQYPEKAIQYLKILYDYYHYIYHHSSLYPTRATQTKKISPQKKALLTDNLNPGLLTWKQITKLAKAYQLPLVTTRIAKSSNISTLSQELGLPMVLKSDPAEGLHRTEKKGVYLSLKSQTSIKKAYQALDKNFQTILAQKQITKGYEFFIGLQRVATFPPMITFGSGGIYTETYQDVVHAFLPLNQKVVLKLLSLTKIGQILQGLRGQEPVNIKELIKLILSLSQLILDLEQIKNIDINPLLISSNSISIVDIKIIT